MHPVLFRKAAPPLSLPLMWKVIQFLIFSAVVMSNVHWEWTPNPYLAGALGYALAFVITVACIRIADGFRWLMINPAGRRLLAVASGGGTR